MLLKSATTSPNQLNSNPVGYELLDDGQIVHIWNNITICDQRLGCEDRGDDYYINLASGLQLTNHYNQYWSRNEFCGAINITGTVNYYCTDVLPFAFEASSDNLTYASVYGNRTIVLAGGRRVDFSITYNLSVNATNITITPRIRNLGTVEIPFELGFAWKIKNIQIYMNRTENYIDITNDTIPLNQSLNLAFRNVLGNMFQIWRLSEDNFSRHFINMYFSAVPNYTIYVKSEPDQYNAPVSLFMPLGTLESGQEKERSFGWKDARIPACNGVSWLSMTQNLAFRQNMTISGLGQEISNPETETEIFNISTIVTGFYLGQTPPACNSWHDNVIQSGGGEITTNYPTGTQFKTGEFKNVTPFTFGQGSAQSFNQRVNITVTCGVTHGLAEAQHWWGANLERLNLSCEDRIKPVLTGVKPANNSATTQQNISIQINISDNTRIKAIYFYENWTLGNGQFNLNQSLIFNTQPMYNYSWNLSFVLPVGNYSFNVLFNDTNPENTNTSGIYVFTIQPVKNETEARQAIAEGITGAIPAAAITTDQQIYIVDQAGQHSLGRFDKTTVSGSQRWAFNYLTGSETFTNIASLLNIVNIWEAQLLTYNGIVQQVTEFIGQTKVN